MKYSNSPEFLPLSKLSCMKSIDQHSFIVSGTITGQLHEILLTHITLILLITQLNPLLINVCHEDIIINFVKAKENSTVVKDFIVKCSRYWLIILPYSCNKTLH